MMKETTKLYILVSVWMILAFIQGHSCIRNQNFSFYFLANLSIGLDEISVVEAHAKFIFDRCYSRERMVLTCFYEIYV